MVKFNDLKKGDRIKITKPSIKKGGIGHIIPVDKAIIQTKYKNGRIKVLSDYGHGYMIKVDPFLKSGGKISIIK